MPNVTIYLVAALVAIAMLAGSYLQGRKDGGNIVRADYAQRDIKAATDYAAKEREITEAYRAKEAEWAGKSAAVSKKYQRELANAETSKLAALAALDAGTLRLRLNDSPDSKACGSSTPAPATDTSGNNGAPQGRFLGAVDSAFLVSLAAEADSVVTQLSACQQLLIDERK